MIKRTAVLSLAILASATAASADWKTDLRTLLDPPRRDFAAARSYLRESFDALEAQDKPTAAGLLAFLARKGADPGDELERVVACFESYGDVDPAHDILDDALGREFVLYWGKWKTAYPLATGFVILERIGEEENGPPARLEVGLDLLNDAYYRVSDEKGAISGGLWPAGFHILRLPISGAYDRTGEIAFDLDLKVEGLVVRKRLSVKVEIRSAPALTLPPVQAVSPLAKAAPPPPRAVDGQVSLYVGDKLILTSRKLSSKPAPLKITLPGPSLEGTKPFIVPRKDAPQFNQVSILDAVALAIDTIKNFGKKRKAGAASPPAYRRAQALGFAFTRPGPSGTELRYRASVSLSAANGTIAGEAPARTL